MFFLSGVCATLIDFIFSFWILYLLSNNLTFSNLILLTAFQAESKLFLSLAFTNLNELYPIQLESKLSEMKDMKFFFLKESNFYG